MNEPREPGCRTLVMSRGRRTLPPQRFHVVRTPLDMIQTLGEERANYEVVVLTGQFARNLELVSFLSTTYPTLKIVSGYLDDEPDPYLPALA